MRACGSEIIISVSGRRDVGFIDLVRRAEIGPYESVIYCYFPSV